MNLFASPGYKQNKLINSILQPMPSRVIDFRGLNRRPVIEDGEMPDMWNMSSDEYPMLTPRKPRGIMALPSDVRKPLQIFRRYNKLCLIAVDASDDVNFYYDGTKVVSVAGQLSVDTRAMAINTKICFFPEKTYLTIALVNGVVSIGEYGHLDANIETDETTVQSFPVTISNENAVVTLSAGHDLAYDDAIDISGTLRYKASGANDYSTKECTVSCIVESVSGNDITLPRETFIELTGEGASEITLIGKTVDTEYIPASVKREMPDLDYVAEWNNRLWGASNKDNTIYACKLGDPKNWKYYQGTGLDSYYAQQGTDEMFTGIGEYSNHLIFFKPNSLTRVYGTAPSNFQFTNMKAFGVEEGSSLSILTINDVVLYKSIIGIMAYTGSTPQCISENIPTKFKNVVAGTEGQKYYASCETEDGSVELLVFDLEKNLWHKEDDTRFFNTSTVDNRLIYITSKPESDLLLPSETLYPSNSLYLSSEIQAGYAGIINPHSPSEDYEDIEWEAIFGPFDEYMEEHKIYSKLAFLIKAYGPSTVSFYIAIDDGTWEHVKTYENVSTAGEYIPIIPRRCDRYSIKIHGRGNCAIKSLTRRVIEGSLEKI